jgi:cephalosporin-C deacetylase-like acetyl esterase
MRLRSSPLLQRLVWAICVFLVNAKTFAQNPGSDPWNLERLREPPRVEWIDESGSVRSLFYAGEDYQGKATRVFAYYASPATLVTDGATSEVAMSVPGVVLVHGGGGTAFREWVELWAKRGYAAIAMDLAGNRPDEGKNAHDPKNRTRLEDGGPGQGDDEKFGSIDLEPTEQWPYHAVANVIRAHSLLRSFQEVDSERTALTGISWGGYLTCIVAGVDDRFKAAVPVYGCGFLHENSAWLNRFASMSVEQRQRWIDLWDPSNYLRHVSMPILFVNGTNDFAYPLDSYMKSFDVVPVEKQLCVTVNMPHGHPPGWARDEIGWFIDQHLNHAPSLLRVNDLVVDEDKLAAQVVGEQEIAAAELHYTLDTNPINQRKWTTQVASMDGKRVIAKLPPKDATAWFLTVADARGAIISSRVYFR